MTLLRELQRDALDPRVDITTLLRKARVLAARLNNPEFVAWIQHEQNGYPIGVDLPNYRILNVSSKAHLVMGNRHMTMAPVMASKIPEEFRHWATISPCLSSISELSSLIAGADKAAQPSVICEWPQEIAVRFGGAGYGGGRLRVQCISAYQDIGVAPVAGIIETVRNNLLEFVLQIEAEAPDVGEVAPGEIPLPQERVTQIFNSHISGGVTHIAATDSSRFSSSVRVDSMSNSQVLQAGRNSSQTLSFSLGSQERLDLERLVREISERINELNLDEKARRRAEAQIRTIQAQLADDEAAPGIIAQAGATLRNVTEGAIGSLIAAAVQPTAWHWVAQAMSVLFPR
jgi:hypothetical protein